MDVTTLSRERIKRSIKITKSGCWEWQLFIRRNGYGQMKHNGKTVDAHRVAYECFIGPIPDGQYVCHRCDVKRCCNPEHLFTGTQSDNMNDHRRKGRRLGPSRKMTPAMVVEAKRLIAEGHTYKQAGFRLGVSAMTV